jgi:hypothetical protein
MEVSAEVNNRAKKKGKIIGRGRELGNEEIYNLYALLNNVRVEISKRK